jgi:hypothetical protein
MMLCLSGARAFDWGIALSIAPLKNFVFIHSINFFPPSRDGRLAFSKKETSSSASFFSTNCLYFLSCTARYLDSVSRTNDLCSQSHFSSYNSLAGSRKEKGSAPVGVGFLC